MFLFSFLLTLYGNWKVSLEREKKKKVLLMAYKMVIFVAHEGFRGFLLLCDSFAFALR